MRVGTIWALIFLVRTTQQIGILDQSSRKYQCKPIFLMHGLLGSEVDFVLIAGWIETARPGTVIFISNAYPNALSLTALWIQLNGTVGEQLLDFCAKYPSGITAIGHSQGALLIRAFIELFPNHCIHTFISIAGPLRGVYGIGAFVKLLEPYIQIPLLLDTGTELFYKQLSQETISVANFWTDPFDFQRYLKDNVFMPRINNEGPYWNQSFKDGFLKPKLHITIGGHDDAIVVPWQSSHYEFYDKNKNVVPYQKSDIYQRNTFGLRDLEQSGRWIRHSFSGLDHFEFILDENVFQKGILPYLDCTEKIDT